jgi:hypothetical protein
MSAEARNFEQSQRFEQVDSRKSLLCILACHQLWKTSCILGSEVSKTGSLKRQQIERTLLSAPKILDSLSKRRLSLIT